MIRRPTGLMFSTASLLVALVGTGLVAQEPGVPGQYGEDRGRTGDHERRRATINADQLDGPPYPQFVTMRFELDSTESLKYQQVYDSFMVATKPLRDTAKAAIGAPRGSGGYGGYAGEGPGEHAGAGHAGRADADQIERLSNELNKQENQFDKKVKSVMTSAHYKDYKQWRDEQRKQAEEQEQQSRPREPSN
jgi:hypothetical protein